MTDVSHLLPPEVAGHRTAELTWKQLRGSPRFDYEIDYAIALLSADEAVQRVEFLSAWAPRAYCHFHRHIGATSSVIVGGELHVYESDEFLDLHKVRKLRHATGNDGGDVHMEHAGPEGAIAYYDMRAKDGRLFDILANDGRVIRTLMFDDFIRGTY